MPPPLPAAAGHHLLRPSSALRLRTLPLTLTHLNTTPRTPLRTPLPRTQQYHSHTHPPPPGPFTPSESHLLSHAYAHVPATGFTPTALALGARSAGLLDISPTILPRGVFSLILFHLVTRREALASQAAAAIPTGAVAERVEALTWARLKGNEEAGVVGGLQEVCCSPLFGDVWAGLG